MNLSGKSWQILVPLVAVLFADQQAVSAQQPPPASDAARGLEQQMALYRQLLPRELKHCTARRHARLEQLARRVEAAAAALAEPVPEQNLAAALRRAEALLVCYAQLDQMAEQVLGLRRDVAAVADPQQRKERARHWLQVAGNVLELQGRVRFHLLLGLDETAAVAQAHDADRRRLVELLLRHQSAEGARVMALDLNDPPEPIPGVAPCSWETRRQILRLIRLTGEVEAFGHVLRLIRNEQAPVEIRLLGLETLRRLGVPQPPDPESAESGLPRPAVTPAELLALLRRVPPRRVPLRLRGRYRELLAWLARRTERGIEPQEGFPLGRVVVRPGDWLLMRNPSPYNLFTDLAPGLFTHVGVVTWRRGSDGRGRIVVVDFPERGTRVPATNVEIYVLRTLHYVLLRHPHPEIQHRMAQVARDVIGNPFVFDLNFRTSLVKQLRGKPLRGRKLETYCAGLLLLCAQETGRPLEEFFPITEQMAPGHTAENLARLGIRLGRGFVSPTGALFSPTMQLAGRRRPLYDPLREIQQAVYVHFARQLQQRRLALRPESVQQVRIKLAQAAQGNPALAALLARLHGVDPSMDLLSAARTAAVVETLDKIAYENSRQFAAAWAALLDPPAENAPEEELARRQHLRKRHRALLVQWEQGQLSLFQLRRRLVEYYIRRGQEEVQQRFFRQGAETAE